MGLGCGVSQYHVEAPGVSEETETASGHLIGAHAADDHQLLLAPLEAVDRAHLDLAQREAQRRRDSSVLVAV